MAFNNGGSDITLINEEGLTLTVEHEVLTPQNTNPNTEHDPKQKIRLFTRSFNNFVTQEMLGEGCLTLCAIVKLENHPKSAVHDV
jgi:hypothetical protein